VAIVEIKNTNYIYAWIQQRKDLGKEGGLCTQIQGCYEDS